MKSKRYAVEAQAWRSDTWEVTHYTNSLPVAKRYAASMAQSPTIRATQVVDPTTGLVMAWVYRSRK